MWSELMEEMTHVMWQYSHICVVQLPYPQAAKCAYISAMFSAIAELCVRVPERVFSNKTHAVSPRCLGEPLTLNLQ